MKSEYERILVGVDGSEEGTKALDRAIQVAVRNHAELIIANVIDSRSFEGTSGFESVIIDDSMKEAKKFMADYEGAARSRGVKVVKTRIEFGSPKLLLAEEIPADEGVDLIMIGSTGLTALERLFLGSVAEYIIRHAPCDVLVVRNEDNVRKENKK